MTIKSDSWIKEMSQKKGMITPFESNQIKEKKGSDHKLISYGLSSYGPSITRPFLAFRDRQRRVDGSVVAVAVGQHIIEEHGRTLPGVHLDAGLARC